MTGDGAEGGKKERKRKSEERGKRRKEVKIEIDRPIDKLSHSGDSTTHHSRTTAYRCVNKS